jgi:hypothetical protein
MIRYAIPRHCSPEARGRIQAALDQSIQAVDDDRFVGRGQIDSASLDKIILMNLDEFKVDEDFDLLAELAKDLEFLHPRRSH